MRFAFSFFVVAVVLGVAVQAAPTTFLESWTLTVLPLWAAQTSRLHAALPVSVTLALAAALLLALVVSVAVAPAGRRLRRAAVLVVGGVALLGAGFVLSFGVSYGRATLAEVLDLPPAGAELAALEAGLERLVAEIHRSAPDAPLAQAPAPALRRAIASASLCVAAVDAHVSGRPIDVPPTVRELPPGTLLRAGFAGIALPWLLEPHVDGGLPGASRVAVATHELTHTAGWAREADTDALSVLAALSCDDPVVRYAGALHGAQLMASAIATTVGPGHPARLRTSERFAALPEVAMADRRAMADAFARYHQPATARTVGRVYDAYLRSQGVEDGLADYGNAGGVLASALAACSGDPGAGHPWCAAPDPQEARSVRR
jgi:hypothetical protein